MSKGNSSSDYLADGEVNGEVDRGGDIDVHEALDKSGVLSELVADMFLEIMLRLALESLCGCRWVCKSWYKLIKSPFFAKIQFDWAIEHSSPCVFFWSHKNNFYLIDDQVFDHLETSATAHNLELDEFKKVFHGYELALVGYVNGLVCFGSHPLYNHPSPFYICNPVTRELITIPKSPNYKALVISGFGFDPTANEYKVVCVLQYFSEDAKYLTSKGEVYTLGSSEWKMIEDIPRTETLECGVFLKGSVHWISYVSDALVIVTFSVGAEKFNLIQPPCYMLQRDGTYKRLEVVEEQLCCLCEVDPCKSYEVWVMEEYGVNTWVKKHCLNWNVRGWCLHGPNFKLRNGEFLLHCETEEGFKVPFKEKEEFMVYFEPKRETFRPIRMNHLKAYRIQLIIQVGSLFSPKDAVKSRRGEAYLKKLEGIFLC